MAIITAQSSTGGLFSITLGKVDLGAEGPDGTVSWVESGETPTNGLITDDQSLTIDASWKSGGALSVILASLATVQWDCNVFLEHMGGGEHAAIYNRMVPFVDGATTCAITIPAGLSAGVYRVVFTMTLRAGALKVPFGGFGDLGFIQVMADF